MSEKLIFNEVLPFPPSVNKYWRMGKTWNGKRVTHLSSEAKKFTHEVAVIIAKKQARHTAPNGSEVNLFYTQKPRQGSILITG